MPDSSTLTIRIDDELKRRLEAAAAAADQTVTEYVVRSVRLRMVGACAVCGHDGGALLTQAPGMTKAFGDWMLGLRTPRQVAIATIEPEGTCVYYGNGAPNGLHDSYIDLEISTGALVVTAKIPRARIEMWVEDQEAEALYGNLVASGYVDGNHRVALKWAQVSRPRPAYKSPGHSRNRRR